MYWKNVFHDEWFYEEKNIIIILISNYISSIINSSVKQQKRLMYLNT